MAGRTVFLLAGTCSKEKLSSLHLVGDKFKSLGRLVATVHLYGALIVYAAVRRCSARKQNGGFSAAASVQPPASRTAVTSLPRRLRERASTTT